MEPEPAEKYNKKRFFSRERPEPPRYTEEPQPEPEPDSKGDWMKKDDFK